MAVSLAGTTPTPRRREAATLRGAPLQPGTLIGREAELASPRHQLRLSDVRLLTLTGPAGSGKTRLAIALAADIAPSFSHGAVFIGLAPIFDAEIVMPTVAGA